MAKKKASRAKKAVASLSELAPELGDKSRMELRLDRNVYTDLKRLADNTGISMNQLMQGIARWAVDKLKPGEPVRDENGYVTVRPQVGCLWAGREGRMVRIPDEELWEIYEQHPDSLDEWDKVRKDLSPYGKGEVYIFLDFTERRVVRDDLETQPSG